MTTTELRDHTVLVTGATAGIGRAVALRLAAMGAHVVVHGRDAARADAVVRTIREGGGQARAATADLTDAGETLRLAKEAGPVDLLVNNAGTYSFSSTIDTDAAAFDAQFAVNTRAPFLLVGALVPGMVERGRGAIVNITSSAATSPAPIGAAYGASKAALELLTRSWATEFAGAGIRVNAVSPGPVRTDGTERMLGENVEMLGRGSLRGTVGAPEEIAAAVAFLAGPESAYVNGTVLAVDGGALSTMPG